MFPLTLHCGFGVWIGEARLGAAQCTGNLDPQDVAAARRLWKAREQGKSVGSLLAEEVDADPEYRDWVEDVLVPARTALTAPPAAAPVVPIRRRPAFFGNPLAMAASVLLMVSLGLAGGLLWQDRRLDDLASERTRTQEELRMERERLNEELRWVEEEYRRELTEAEQSAKEARQRDQERIAELEQRLEGTRHPEALLNVPFVGLTPRDPVRGGEIEEVSLPEKASLFFLLLSVPDTPPFPSYHLEIVSRNTSRVAWKGEGLKANPLNEVSLILPRDALSPGDYRLRLSGMKNGETGPVEEYELRIVYR